MRFISNLANQQDYCQFTNHDKWMRDPVLTRIPTNVKLLAKRENIWVVNAYDTGVFRLPSPEIHGLPSCLPPSLRNTMTDPTAQDQDILMGYDEYPKRDTPSIAIKLATLSID